MFINIKLIISKAITLLLDIICKGDGMNKLGALDLQ
jgi:hypothetical protein